MPTPPGTEGDEGKTMQQAGADLREAMQPPGWNVSKLARESGVERRTLYAWWNGEARPTTNSLRRVAAALGVQVTDLAAAYGEPIDPYTEPPLHEVIRELVGVLRPIAERAAQEQENARRLDELDLALRRLTARAIEAPSGPRAPRGKAGAAGS